MKKLALFLFLSLSLFAELNLPNLSGRVVDEANILSQNAKETIEKFSEILENNSTTQFVVATVNSLQGSDIESYANALARKWELGVKGVDNGVLLLVAMEDKKIRIEVGYGLEGILTDALASKIINREILPYFRKGEFERGVVNGANKIALVLSKAEFEVEEDDELGNESFAFIGAIFAFFGLTFASNFTKSTKFRHFTRAGLLSSFIGFFTYVFSAIVIGEYAYLAGLASFILGVYFLYPFIKKHGDDSSGAGFSGSGRGGFGGGGSRSRSSRSGGFGGRGGGFGGGGASGGW